MNDATRPDTDAAPKDLCTKIVEAASEAVIFADREGRIRLWNRGAELVFGYSAAEVVGERLDIIIPERLRRAHWDAFDRSVESGRTKHSDRVLTTRSVHKNGSKLYVDLSFGLVKDADGFVLGAFAVGRDCTQRYLAEANAKARVAALEAQVAQTASNAQTPSGSE
jgi:PAS domain S-box-containing protein